MNNLKRFHKHISALYDGEFAASEVELVFAKLGGAEERATWSVYQKIGDVLRADRSGFDLSENFNSRMSVLLAAEPSVVRAPSSSMGRKANANENRNHK